VEGWIMIRIIIIFLAVVCLFSPSFAIEKKVIHKENKTVVEDQDSLNIKAKPQEESSAENSTAKRKIKAEQKEFDDFVDKNNNGIDDRSEKKKEKTQVEKKEQPKK
jgi:hypothetical protein